MPETPISLSFLSTSGPYPVVYSWDPSKQPIYCEKLLGTECTKIYENLLCKIFDIDRDPRSVIGIFDDYMNTAINGLFHKRKVVNTNDFPRNKWFDDECKSAKRKLHGMPKNYMTENDRNAYNELMREYKALIQRKNGNTIKQLHLMLNTSMNVILRDTGSFGNVIGLRHKILIYWMQEFSRSITET